MHLMLLDIIYEMNLHQDSSFKFVNKAFIVAKAGDVFGSMDDSASEGEIISISNDPSDHLHFTRTLSPMNIHRVTPSRLASPFRESTVFKGNNTFTSKLSLNHSNILNQELRNDLSRDLEFSKSLTRDKQRHQSPTNTFNMPISSLRASSPPELPPVPSYMEIPFQTLPKVLNVPAVSHIPQVITVQAPPPLVQTQKVYLASTHVQTSPILSPMFSSTKKLVEKSTSPVHMPTLMHDASVFADITDCEVLSLGATVEELKKNLIESNKKFQEENKRSEHLENQLYSERRSWEIRLREEIAQIRADIARKQESEDVERRVDRENLYDSRRELSDVKSRLDTALGEISRRVPRNEFDTNLSLLKEATTEGDIMRTQFATLQVKFAQVSSEKQELQTELDRLKVESHGNAMLLEQLQVANFKLQEETAALRTRGDVERAERDTDRFEWDRLRRRIEEERKEYQRQAAESESRLVAVREGFHREAEAIAIGQNRVNQEREELMAVIRKLNDELMEKSKAETEIKSKLADSQMDARELRIQLLKASKRPSVWKDEEKNILDQSRIKYLSNDVELADDNDNATDWVENIWNTPHY